jgi:hypothetical protein
MLTPRVDGVVDSNVHIGLNIAKQKTPERERSSRDVVYFVAFVAAEDYRGFAICGTVGHKYACAHLRARTRVHAIHA